MALYGPLCYEAPVAANGYVTVVSVLLKAVFPGGEPDVRRRAMAVVARPVRSAQGWSRRGSLTRAECSAFVLSTVHSARPWRVRPSDAPAGDAIPPPTLPRSLPGETSTELDAFPYSLTKLQRPPFCTFLVLVAACPGVTTLLHMSTRRCKLRNTSQIFAAGRYATRPGLCWRGAAGRSLRGGGGTGGRLGRDAEWVGGATRRPFRATLWFRLIGGKTLGPGDPRPFSSSVVTLW